MPWTAVLAILVVWGVLAHGFRPTALYVESRRLPPLQASPLGSSPANVQVKAHALDLIQNLSESAIRGRGTEAGLESMVKLSQMCAERLPFDFDDDDVESFKSDEQTVISKLPCLLPAGITNQIFEKVEGMLQRGWLSTNPDSVDGLPSFHLNLVSNGKPIASGENLDDFQVEIQSMLDLVGPLVYDKLLPHVKEQLKSDSIEVSDVFIRRYGHDIVEGKSRNGISAHYDVFSRVTSVVALDDVAQEGRNGLYTTVQQFSDKSHGARTSNHAALRRFFPLGVGDAVVHTWNVLHGVDVEEGIDRASLIVWFTEKTTDNDFVSPSWLENHPNLESDNVAQFVLASATESSEPAPGEGSLSMNQGVDKQIGGLAKAIDLYLSSAASGNSFAMTRLGSLLEEGLLDAPALETARDILSDLRQSRTNDIPAWVEDQNDASISLARGFWYEASLCGNALAQIALADEIMASFSAEPDARLLAATLFGLAAQQGNEQAVESLTRLVQLDLQFSGVSSQEEFETNPVVQTARAATRLL